MSRLPPTGTVTLLLADVEESTHLWQMCPEDMATAIAHLDHTVSEAITNHGGVQPVKRYEGRLRMDRTRIVRRWRRNMDVADDAEYVEMLATLP